MAASAKRKQEEKHLQLLREMTSRPANRKCFDCEQRGPTYVNMTVGSFICTTCSGILRGLNPPHRVKSISMTTFTQQEIEFLQKHSNEVCKHIWLGLYDECSSAVPDFREPQRVKEFLQEKYEKKRWYVPPDQATLLASSQPPTSGPSASGGGGEGTPEVQPLRTLHLNKTPSNQSPLVGRSQASEKKFDLLSDLGGDIFAAPPSHSATGASNFANFAHFGKPSGGSVSAPPLPSGSAKDRYAALAELDSASKGTLFDAAPGPTAASHQPVLPSIPQGFAASTNPFVASAIPPDSGLCTNPFQINSRSSASGSMSMPAGFGNASSFCLPTSFSGSFPHPFPPAAYHQQPNGGFSVYGPVKPPMGFAPPAVSSNPFMSGAPAGSHPTGGSSTNPFL